MALPGDAVAAPGADHLTVFTTDRGDGMTRTRRERAGGARRRPGPGALAHWSVDHPWRAVGLWLVIVVTCLAVGMVAGTRMLDQGASGVGDSGRALELLNGADFGPKTADEMVLIERADGGPLSASDAARAGAALRSGLGREPGVSGVSAPVPAPDGAAALVTVNLRDAQGAAARTVGGVQDRVRDVASRYPGLRIGQTGPASVAKAMDDTLGEDFQSAERMSIPVTFLILLVVFGAVVAALLPLLLALTAIVAAFGLTAVLSHAAPQSQMLGTMLLLVGVAVGVDYALFLVRRYRDERSGGRDVRDAAHVAVDTSGHAVVLSGVTVMVAMSAMLLSREPIFTSMGVASMVVVACAVFGAMLAVPAVLSLLGDRLNWIPVPLLARLRARDAGASRFWGAVAGRVVRRPRAALAVSAGALVLLALPVLGMQLKMPSLADMPRDTDAMRTYDRVQEHFPSRGAAHEVVVAPRAGLTMRSPQVRAAVAALVADAARDRDLVLAGTRLERVSRDGRVSVITLPHRGEEAGPEGAASLERLRDHLLPATVGRVGEAHVMGFAAEAGDFQTLARDRLPLMMAFVVALTFVVMLMSFRNAWLSLATVGLNGLSVSAAYGFLVLVFQHHWFDGVAGIHANGGVVAWLPMFLFVILFGLSMDYHVFVLSRVREAYRSGMPARDAIREGVAHTGSVVTSAAVVMVAAFGIFATLSTVDMKQLGIGLAVAIGLDATLVRGVLLPSAMAVLGERAFREHAWLPGRRRAARALADA